MYSDGVLQDVCFNVEIPVPEKAARQMIIDLAARKLDEIYEANILPDPNLSTCFWPTPCIHKTHCHTGAVPSGKYGFVRVDQIGS